MKYKFAMVKLADIDATGRYRGDMGDIEVLAEDIKERGLIQPLSINANKRLLAGGRRHAASTLAGLTEVPVIIREGNDEIDAREVELMENIRRKDMTWQEQAKLTQEIHRLYSEKDPGWNQRRTAQLLEQGEMNISRAIKLANAIEVNPEIAKCKTADDATKVIKKAEENAIVAELVKRQQEKVEAVDTSTTGGRMEVALARVWKLADANYKIGDVFSGLSSLKTDGAVDLIECDPPYGVDLGTLTDRPDKGADLRSRDKDYVEVADVDYPQFLSKLTKELYRVAGKNCHLVFWFAFRWYPEVIASLTEAGWKPDLVPALWIKDNGRTPRPDLLLARSYEPFIVARKGNPTIIKQGTLNTFVTTGEKNKYHPAQRPVQLMEDILGTFLDEGRQQIVLSPFLGSGAILRACYNLGLSGFGWDSNDEYKDKFLLAVEDDTKRLLART